MKNHWPTKKLGEIVVGIIMVLFAIAFFITKQYWCSSSLLFLLFLLLKLDSLKKLILGPRFEAEFQIPEENIKKDIEENNKSVTKENFSHFRQVEEKVLSDIQKKIGGDMKKQINFVYGIPDSPEFVYRPDGVIKLGDDITFIEIKYILKQEFLVKIVGKAINYLKEVLTKLGPAAKNKLKIKLVLVSNFYINFEQFDLPDGIEIDTYKI